MLKGTHNVHSLLSTFQLAAYISLHVPFTNCTGAGSPLLLSTKSGSLRDLPARHRFSFTSVESLDPRPILGGDLNSELARIASTEPTGSVGALNTIHSLPEDNGIAPPGLVLKTPGTLTPGRLDSRKSKSMDVLSPVAPPKGENDS